MSGFGYKLRSIETGEIRSLSYSEGKLLMDADPGAWEWVNSDKPLNAGFRDRTAPASPSTVPAIGAGRSNQTQPMKVDDDRDPTTGFRLANLPAMAEIAAQPRILGEVTEYSDLVEVLRQRSTELEISREGLDGIAGLQSGYAAKLLSHSGAKGLGRMSLGAVLASLGLRLQVIEDREQMAKMRPRIEASRNTRAASSRRSAKRPAA
jgi:hypothetical protein